jgi:2-oxoglutarate dehydrogenase E2 component (dihydrolipoamide succinyltransferase)
VGNIDEAAAPAPEKDQRARPAKADGQKAAATPAQPAPAMTAQAQPPLSPAVRRLVEQEGINPTDIPASGRGGRLTKQDVLHFLDERRPAAPATEQPAPPPTVVPAVARQELAPTGPQETRQRMSAIRQRIADRLISAQQSTATLTTFNEADLSAVIGLRSRHKDAFMERYGVRLGFMSFFVKACALALRAYPVVNSRIDGADVVTYHSCNIGVAVSTDKGLMVPVLHNADRLSFGDIERATSDLAARARDGKISVADLQGGTFTITNGGVHGSLLSTPIVNPPQSAILAMHAIQKRPVVMDDQIVIRPMMYLALSYDHRLIDGREAVLFLVRVKESIEAPERLLLEV